jgi:hypothetical protein
MILSPGCNLGARRPRAILSTVSVDNSAGNFPSSGNFRYSWLASRDCLIFRQFPKPLKSRHNFYAAAQNIDNVKLFVTVS